MSRDRLYFGKGGQMAVMSEFLVRGWNVAVPEVDIGDDIFVVRDEDFDASRIQVKAARSRTTRVGHTARFSLPLRQLQRPIRPELYYVFAARHQQAWQDFIVIRRGKLDELRSHTTLHAPRGIDARRCPHPSRTPHPAGERLRLRPCASTVSASDSLA